MGNGTVSKLIFIEGGNQGEEIILQNDETTIGRNETNDIVVQSTVVSGIHARIIKDGDTFQIIDLNSSNGTYLNGDKIESPKQMSSGDVIGLGFSIKLEFVQPEEELDTDKTVEAVLSMLLGVRHRYIRWSEISSVLVDLQRM